MNSRFSPQNIFRRASAMLADRASDLWVRSHLRQAGVPHAGHIRTHTTPRELRALFQIALESPAGGIGLEIGSYTGASTCYIAAGLALKGGQLFCVDTWNNETMPEGVRDTFAEFRRNTLGVKQFVTAVRKPSHELSVEDIQVPLRFAFLDGDHSYQAVKGDFEKVEPWLAEDGIIAFHDCLYYEGVSRVIGEALSGGAWRIAGQVGNLFWMRRADFPYK